MRTLFVSVITLVLTSCGGGDKHIEMTDDNAGKEQVVVSESKPVQDLGAEKTPTNSINGKVMKLDKEGFRTKVFDFTKHSAWVFEQDKPCIVDFYADWCKPCKMVAPIMDELAAKYEGKVNFYKLNTDEQREISQMFGIQSIPAILFCPVGSEPQMIPGVMPKENYEKVINDILIK